jgi:hypothetical protein
MLIAVGDQDHCINHAVTGLQTNTLEKKMETLTKLQEILMN